MSVYIAWHAFVMLSILEIHVSTVRHLPLHCRFRLPITALQFVICRVMLHQSELEVLEIIESQFRENVNIWNRFLNIKRHMR